MLTPEEFASRLSEELERNEWGTIDPHLFKMIGLGRASQVADAAALREILSRVLDVGAAGRSPLDAPTRLNTALDAARDLLVGFCCGCGAFDVPLLKMDGMLDRYRCATCKRKGGGPRDTAVTS